MPSHTSSALQVLDVAIFAPLKSLFREVIDAYLHQTHPHALKKEDILRLFHKSWVSTNQMADELEKGKFKGAFNAYARKGFASVGLYPLNMNWVEEHPEVFAISNKVFSTSADSENAELAAVAIEEDLESLPAALAYKFFFTGQRAFHSKRFLNKGSR